MTGRWLCKIGLHRWKDDLDVWDRKICRRCGAGRWTR